MPADDFNHWLEHTTVKCGATYVVRIKKNWRIAAIVHSMFNLWGVFSLFSFLSRAA
jgi:hypothetical protein